MARIDDEEIGGLEYGPVRWRLPPGTPITPAMNHVGRLILGDLKRQMQLGEITQGQSIIHTFADGVTVQAKSIFGEDGAADQDEIVVTGGPLHDICLGFIVRITSKVKQHLILNIKEPVEEDQDGGIQTEYWHDTALTNYEDGYNTYDEYVADFPNYPDNLLYGFEWSFNAYSTLNDPPNARDRGYKTDERGPIDSNSKIGLSWVYPGTYTRTDAYVANAQYAWYGQLWSVDGFGIPIAPLEDPQWGGYQSIIDATFSIPALDGGSPTAYNTNLAAAISAYATGSTASKKGLTITSALQKTHSPIARYFNSNYEIDNNVIIVKAVNDDEDFHAFAVVKPGVQRYYVPELYRQMVKTTSTVTDYWTYTNPFHLTTPFIPISGQTSDPSLPAGTVLGMGHSFGNSATKDTSLVIGVPYEYATPIKSVLTRTVTDEYDFEEWQMFTTVKGGEYEIDIKGWWGANLNNITDLTFDVDIVLFGSKYQTFRYSDAISRTRNSEFYYDSQKLCRIKLLNSVEYREGAANPHVSLIDRA
jgi:hypothetical protein